MLLFPSLLLSRPRSIVGYRSCVCIPKSLFSKLSTILYITLMFSRTFSTDCTEIHSALRYQMDIWSSTDCGSGEKCRYEVSYSTMHDSKGNFYFAKLMLRLLSLHFMSFAKAKYCFETTVWHAGRRCSTLLIMSRCYNTTICYYWDMSVK